MSGQRFDRECERALRDRPIRRWELEGALRRHVLSFRAPGPDDTDETICVIRATEPRDNPCRPVQWFYFDEDAYGVPHEEYMAAHDDDYRLGLVFETLEEMRLDAFCRDDWLLCRFVIDDERAMLDTEARRAALLGLGVQEGDVPQVMDTLFVVECDSEEGPLDIEEAESRLGETAFMAAVNRCAFHGTTTRTDHEGGEIRFAARTRRKRET